MTQSKVGDGADHIEAASGYAVIHHNIVIQSMSANGYNTGYSAVGGILLHAPVCQQEAALRGVQFAVMFGVKT